MDGPVCFIGRVEFFITCVLSIYTITSPPDNVLSEYICVRFCRRYKYAPRSAWVDEGLPLPIGMFPPVLRVCEFICIAHAAVRLFPDTLPSIADISRCVCRCCLKVWSRWGEF